MTSVGLGKGALYCNYVSCIFLQVAHNIKTTRELQLRKKKYGFKSLETDIATIHCKSISLKPETYPVKLPNLVLSPTPTFQSSSLL